MKVPLNRRHHILIPSTAAQDSGEFSANFVAGGQYSSCLKRRRRDKKTGRAESALQRVLLVEDALKIR